MTDETEKGTPVDALGEMLGKNFGQLFVISMFQARATLTLADAIKKDPAVTTETKQKAEETMAMIDKIIEQMESAMPDLGGPIKIKDFVGRSDE